MKKLYSLSIIAILFLFFSVGIFAQTITTGTIVGSPLCACGTVDVPFTSTGTFDAGNVYTAQLSDSTGSFSTLVDIGTLSSSGSSGTIAATIPCNAGGSEYRIRVVSNSPPFTGTDNGSNLTINYSSTPIVTISPSPGSTVCSGIPVTFTATPVNEGTVPTYQWRINGTPVVANASTYTTTSLNNGDQLTCVMTSNATCATGNPATSDTIIMVIQPLVVAAVSIQANPSGSICLGTTVTFAAISDNGGMSPNYQWSINGVDVGTNSTFFTTSTLNNGDQVTCVMTSNANCVTGSPAIDNITASVGIAPSISLQVVNAGCGEDNGGIASIISGSGGSYTYEWSNQATTATLDNLAAGTYFITVTDQTTGCTTSDTAVVGTSGGLLLSVSTTPTSCKGNTGTASVIDSNGTAPFHFNWSNNDTTQTINNLAAGMIYSVTVTDAIGCSGISGAVIEPSQPLGVTIIPDPDTIICGINNGSMILEVSGRDSTPVYQYNWSNGATISNPYTLGAGNYSVTVTDLNTQCTGTASTTIYCKKEFAITATVYNDVSGDCNDFTGQAVDNIKINLYKSSVLYQQGYTVVDYSTMVDSGTYTVAIDTTGLPYTFTCPAGGDTTITISSANPVVDLLFGLECEPGFDIGVWSIVKNSFLFPGDTATITINAGDINSWFGVYCDTALISGTMNVVITGPASYEGAVNGAIAPSYAGNDTLEYNIADFSFPNIAFKLAAQSGAQSGQQVCIDATVTPNKAGDRNPVNNSLTQCFVVSNSFDPNEKEVSPVGSLLYNYGGWLTYTIHFQNTGTASAQNITIEDTLDANLAPETFQLVGYSFEPQVQINGHYLTFTFPDIYLPDSALNPTGSIGYVEYKIKPLTNVPGNTNISNTAFIYFDFNAPVKTNTASNLILPAGINELEVGGSGMEVYPNPVGNMVNVLLPKECEGCMVTITDMFGREVKTTAVPIVGEKILTLDLTNLAAGMYFIRVSNENETMVGKVVKE